MQVLPGWIPVFYLGTVEPWSCGPPDFLFVRSISLSTFKHSRLCAMTLIKRQRAFWQMSIWSTVQNFHPLQLRWLLNSFDTWRVEATDDTALQHAYYPATLHSKTWSMTIGASGLSVSTHLACFFKDHELNSKLSMLLVTFDPAFITDIISFPFIKSLLSSATRKTF